MNNSAECVGNGVSDIPGVKNEGEALPEKISPEISRVAGGEENGASSAVKENEEKAFTPDDSAPEGVGEDADKEFEALIKGRYRDAYRKRTEGIVRKRLAAQKKSEKISEGEKASGETIGESDCGEKEENSFSVCPTAEAKAVENETAEARNSLLVSEAKEKNRARPRENGVGGSIGIVTGINAYALTGSDVLALIKRAGSGEKITFGRYEK